MATKQITDLDAANDIVLSDDLFVIRQGATDKKLKADILANKLKSEFAPSIFHFGFPDTEQATPSGDERVFTAPGDSGDTWVVTGGKGVYAFTGSGFPSEDTIITISKTDIAAGAEADDIQITFPADSKTAPFVSGNLEITGGTSIYVFLSTANGGHASVEQAYFQLERKAT